jgi:hypothetical protein
MFILFIQNSKCLERLSLTTVQCHRYRKMSVVYISKQAIYNLFYLSRINPTLLLKYVAHVMERQQLGLKFRPPKYVGYKLIGLH